MWGRVFSRENYLCKCFEVGMSWRYLSSSWRWRGSWKEGVGGAVGFYFRRIFGYFFFGYGFFFVFREFFEFWVFVYLS